MKTREALYGFARRRECLVPTWRGWLLILLFGAAMTSVALLEVHPFLASTRRVPAEILVVEGWVPDYVLKEAKTEFEKGHYKKLFVTGGPLGQGEPLSEYKTYAELGAAVLVRLGMPRGAVEAIPAPLVQRDRTYSFAVILKNWLHGHGIDEARLNVVSLGVHARRSQLLFQNALGETAQVGIIAIRDRNYDAAHWWRSSQGVRVVISELVAYIYAVIVFPLT